MQQLKEVGLNQTHVVLLSLTTVPSFSAFAAAETTLEKINRTRC